MIIVHVEQKDQLPKGEEGGSMMICDLNIIIYLELKIKKIKFIYMYIYYLSINIKFRGQFHQSFCNGISIGV